MLVFLIDVLVFALLSCVQFHVIQMHLTLTCQQLCLSHVVTVKCPVSAAELPVIKPHCANRLIFLKHSNEQQEFPPLVHHWL